MSFIAFDLDALNAAPAVARASGVTENDVLGGLLRLWAWCFRSETDIVSALQLRGHFGCDAGPALEAFGFLAKTDAGWRVRGAERYLKVKASQRSAAARTNARRASATPSVDRQSTDTPPSVDHSVHSRPSPNTEHRTPNTKEEEATPPSPAADILVFEEPTSPPDTWTGQDFFAWFQACRQETGLVGERWPRRPLGPWWSTVLLTPGMSVARLKAAVAAFGASKHWREKGLPFAGFAAQWREFVPAAEKTPATRPDTDAWAELKRTVLALPNGPYVATQLEPLRWHRDGKRLVGVTDDAYKHQWLTEFLGPTLTELDVGLDGPSMPGGAA